MANQKYDQVVTMSGTGELNWAGDHILGLLTKGVAFTSAHTLLSEAMVPAGASQISVSEIQSRSLGAEGEAMGLPAVYNKVPKETDYQMLLVKDIGTGDPLLLAFYDENVNSDPLRLINNGTLIVRPVEIVGADPPTIGMWFSLAA